MTGEIRPLDEWGIDGLTEQESADFMAVLEEMHPTAGPFIPPPPPLGFTGSRGITYTWPQNWSELVADAVGVDE